MPGPPEALRIPWAKRDHETAAPDVDEADSRDEGNQEAEPRLPADLRMSGMTAVVVASLTRHHPRTAPVEPDPTNTQTAPDSPKNGSRR